MLPSGVPLTVCMQQHLGLCCLHLPGGPGPRQRKLRIRYVPYLHILFVPILRIRSVPNLRTWIVPEPGLEGAV